MLLYNIGTCLLSAFIFTRVGAQVPSSAYTADRLVTRAGANRDVYVVHRFTIRPDLVDETGSSHFASHSALWISGTDQDGPVQIELTSARREPPVSIEVKITELGMDKIENGPPNEGRFQSFPHGTTTKTNGEILDHETGKGILLDTMKEFTNYRMGPDHPGDQNTCHNYVAKLLQKIPNEPQVPGEKTQLYWKDFDKYIAIPKYAETSYNQPLGGINVFRPNSDPNQPPERIKRWAADELGCTRRFRRKRASCTGDLKPDDSAPTSKSYNEFSLFKWAKDLPEDELSSTASDGLPRESKDSTPIDSLSDADKTRKVSMIRNKGELKTYTAVTKNAMKALGLAADVVGAAFVILDLVNKEWQAAAIGIASSVAGIAVAAAVGGPVGWIVGTVVGALFAILPGLGKPKELPKKDDIQGIVQYKMFGDPKHTGNEKCREKGDENTGNPDCQAVYGAGTLSMTLGMSNFDTVAFLTQFNGGYPMTIPEIAQNFHLIDEFGHNKDDGADKMATITCHRKECKPAQNAGRGCLDATDTTECNDPKFAINRQNIKIATFDQTADKLYDRIIPKPNGDCKIVTYPGEMNYPRYSISMTGLPSSIVCGITDGLNMQGTSIGSDDTEAAPDIVSPASQSTTNTEGESVKPPPESPFAPLTPDKYLCIWADSNLPTCFPPGTYSAQSSPGFSTAGINALSLPPQSGWSLEVHWTTGGVFKPKSRARRDRPQPQPEKTSNQKFDKSIDPNSDKERSKSLQTFMSGISSQQSSGREAQAGTFTVHAPDDGPDAVCCLFTGVSYGGNVLCLGQGGGALPDGWKKVAQSVSCHAGGAMWMYRDTYGDKTGAVVKGNLEDLAQKRLGGDEGSFKEKVGAVWVSKA